MIENSSTGIINERIQLNEVDPRRTTIKNLKAVNEIGGLFVKETGFEKWLFSAGNCTTRKDSRC